MEIKIIVQAEGILECRNEEDYEKKLEHILTSIEQLGLSVHLDQVKNFDDDEEGEDIDTQTEEYDESDDFDFIDDEY